MVFHAPDWLFDVESSIPAEVFAVLDEAVREADDDRPVDEILADETSFDFKAWYAENNDEFWAGTMNGPKVTIECEIGVRIELGRVDDPL